MNEDDVKKIVGPFNLLCTDDESGRELWLVEYRDARRGWLREELDGSIRGPVSEDYMLDESGCPHTQP